MANIIEHLFKAIKRFIIVLLWIIAIFICAFITSLYAEPHYLQSLRVEKRCYIEIEPGVIVQELDRIGETEVELYCYAKPEYYVIGNGVYDIVERLEDL